MLNQDNLSFFYFGTENMHKKNKKKIYDLYKEYKMN